MLQIAGKALRPGVTTNTIDVLVARSLEERGLSPSMKGFRGFPASMAISVNQELLHGIPSDRRISEGDLIKVQTTGYSGRGFASQGWTYAVGEPSRSDALMLSTATRALRAVQAILKSGARTGDVGAAIQSEVESKGFSVVRTFTGYGMGRAPFQEPHLPGHGKVGQGMRLGSGAILHVHVILKEGSPDVQVLEDGWTATAADGRRGVLKSCMMEVQDQGCRLLTRFLDPS